MSDSAVPGWYHAEGDPPNTERYWDGAAWTEGPRPIGGLSAPETPAIDQSETPTVMSSEPMGDLPASDMPAMDTPSVPDMPAMDTPSVPDMPAMDTPSVPDMPAMDTGTGGLDAGFPSIDDSPTPGGFSTTTPTPAPSTPPSYAPGAALPPVDMGSGPSVTPGFGGPPAFPGAPVGGPGSAMFSEASQATTSLVLSIVGFFCCGLFAVGGVFLGYKEKQGIDAGRRDPANKGQAVAALVIGGITLVIWGLLAVIVLIGFAAGG